MRFVIEIPDELLRSPAVEAKPAARAEPATAAIAAPVQARSGGAAPATAWGTGAPVIAPAFDALSAGPAEGATAAPAGRAYDGAQDGGAARSPSGS